VGALNNQNRKIGQAQGLPLQNHVSEKNMDWKTAEPDEIVCHCRGITKAKIVELILSGTSTIGSIERVTEAGTGCGGCRSKILRIIEIYTAPITPEPRAPGTGCCS